MTGKQNRLETGQAGKEHRDLFRVACVSFGGNAMR